jgi:hypothetical protein
MTEPNISMLPTFCNVRLTSALPETDDKLIHLARVNFGVGKEVKKNGKVRGWGLYSTEALWLIVLLTPKGVPSFISRGIQRPQLAKEGTIDGI